MTLESFFSRTPMRASSSRAGSPSSTVTAAGDRRRLSVPLVSGTEISLLRVGEVEDRDVLVRFDDQQPPRAARKRERLRERQPLRAAAEAVQRVRDDRGGLRGLRQIQERQLVGVLDERLAAVGDPGK